MHALLAGFLLMWSMAAAAQTKNTFYVEGGGPNGLYGLNYARTLVRSEAVELQGRVGVMVIPQSRVSLNSSYSLGTDVFIGSDNHKPRLTFGIGATHFFNPNVSYDIDPCEQYGPMDLLFLSTGVGLEFRMNQDRIAVVPKFYVLWVHEAGEASYLKPWGGMQFRFRW